MIDRLMSQGLVGRTGDPHDRRVRRVALTESGSRLIRSIITAGADKQRRLLSRLSDEELAVVVRASDVMLRAARADAGADPVTPDPAPGRRPARRS
ncbi:MarR family winged helix-turn-helix transcriptional regulator [Mangrovihabitans endophyticus]|nr:winged helix DNA-binding protein [Mangrovihabitans endophyticus]